MVYTKPLTAEQSAKLEALKRQYKIPAHVRGNDVPAWLRAQAQKQK
jgi:hypothetical protein